jgi:hypothetical protein
MIVILAIVVVIVIYECWNATESGRVLASDEVSEIESDATDCCPVSVRRTARL